MIILIDNYDSFTFNIFHYLGEIGAKVKVFRNDEINISQIIELDPKAIFLSPGPCTPNEAGICLDIVKKLYQKYPIFGICLGHQSIGQAFNSKGKYNCTRYNKNHCFILFDKNFLNCWI